VDNKSIDSVQELITKYLAGEATNRDRDVLDKWKAEREENSILFEEWEKTWELSGKFDYSKSRDIRLDLDEEWSNLKGRISQGSQGTGTEIKVIDLPLPPAETSKITPALWVRIAAVFLLAVVSSIVILYLTRDTGRTFYAENPGLEVSLPDGSFIILNSGSELSYEDEFSTDRMVNLKGEAFFEVTSDPDHPFVVFLGHSKVTVVGTSFNVRSFQDHEEVEVVVTTGKVRLSSIEDTKELTLLPGEKGILHRSSGALSKIQNTDINFLAWKTKEISFPDDELDHIVTTLNKIYFSEIEIVTEQIRHCRVSVSFSNQSLDSILLVLEATLEIKIEKKGNKILITGAGC